jgi:uncharacterized membrane protein
MIYAASAVPAGMILPRLEHRFWATTSTTLSSAVALTILSSITSGMIALTGIVFSLAFVMVQFSAVAYSPRLVSWISRDPIIWHSIGIFTATFLYAIGAMAWIDRAGSNGVPLLSSWVVILLMLASAARIDEIFKIPCHSDRIALGRAASVTGHRHAGTAGSWRRRPVAAWKCWCPSATR